MITATIMGYKKKTSTYFKFAAKYKWTSIKKCWFYSNSESYIFKRVVYNYFHY